MRISVISDIHGNLEALNVVLDFLKGKVDFLVSLGDVVGYGPDPSSCVEVISEHSNLLLRGNHEEALLLDDFSRLKKRAEESLKWTKSKLPHSYISKFEDWAKKAEKEDFIFAHASISNPLYKYLFLSKDVEEEFLLMEKKISFIGHTHTPGGFKQSIDTNKIETIFPDFSGRINIKIEDTFKYILNVGSVGQPRDGFPFACVTIYDTQKNTFTLNRLEYDVEKTRKKIIEYGLPTLFAKRIIQGI